MSDIISQNDIQLLVDRFYDKVRKDQVIGLIFNTMIGDDWSHHLPIMYSFWGTVLLNKEGYKGNPIAKHVTIDKQIPLEKAHYNQWLALWEQTVDELYTGEIANHAKQKARLMMQLIEIKVDNARTGKSIL